MPTDEEFEELRLQIAALTELVHHLEKRLEFSARKTTTTNSPSEPKERHSPERDLESRIGGHWLNRLGIIAVLIGVSYFLKFAFENEWVGPPGRVVIGLASGLAIVFWSEHVRQSGYAIFSYSLKAVGIGVLYLSLWASSQLYQLVPNTLAFFAMTAVTAATIGLALWQDAEVIAAFATLGAFITPVALSTGENDASGLFSYITLLDVGTVVLVRYRPWIRILAGSYVGTLILYSIWHSNFYTPDQFAIGVAAVSAIFITFALTPFVDKRESDANGVVLIALANAGTYFFEVWELFEHASNSRDSAIVAVALGGMYFMVAYLLSANAPSAAIHVHSAIGAALLVIAVPIGLQAQWITVGWLVEAAALMEASRLTQNEVLKILSGVSVALGICGLLFFDQFDVEHLVLNERMAISVAAIVVLAFIARQWTEAAPFLVILLNIVALVALNREVIDAFSGIVRAFAYSALWMAYGAALMFVGFWKSSRFLRWQALVLIFATICKVFIYDTSSLNRGYRILSLIALGLLLLGTSFLYQHLAKSLAASRPRRVN